MAHVQLRRQGSGERLLPVFYSDNYVSLLPGENSTISIEADARDLGGDKPRVILDGWNVTTADQSFPDHGGAAIGENEEARVASGRPEAVPVGRVAK